MFCIGAIFKNEGPYILEWIAYHQVIGVDKFYIVDNISNDGSSELLCKLHSLGIINRIEYKNEPNEKPQLQAYNKIIQELNDEDEFIAFIDADEFLYPADIDDGITSIINIFKDKDIGAIALNWAVYGSSHCIHPRSDSLVIERFDHRASHDAPVNKHYKSVIRKSSLISAGKNPHFFNVDKKYVLSDSSELSELTGVSDKICWEGCRVNHYVIKSKNEFFSKKATRGRAAGNNSDLNSKFFRNHDMNSVREQYPYSFISKVKDKIDLLKISIANESPVTTPLSLYSSPRIRGIQCVDTLQIENSFIYINGWAVDKDRKPLHSALIVINNTYFTSDFLFTRTERRDVYNGQISSELDCGFEIAFDIKKIFIHGVSSISIYAVDEKGNAICELDLTKHKETLSQLFKNLI